ncbi:MAG TPA: hypothetical protein VH854_02085 [Thermoanaerobaculia bacterium]|jgi:hypothetical protein|nr:hypothetical protein [Thermoanaerobaculia bacterium]
MTRKKKPFLEEHSLSLIAGGILTVWVVLYARSDPGTHIGAFYGNSIADWSGAVVVIVGTKFLFERGSRESKPVTGTGSRIQRFLKEHSLSIMLIITGGCWALLYARLDAGSRWGQVVGNVLSEWVSLLGLVLLTKKFIERGSEESRGAK